MTTMNHSQKALSRVILQYQNSPKFLEWIQTLTNIAQSEIEAPLETLINLFDIDSQEGELLDLIGRFVVQPRNHPLLEDDEIYRILIKSKIFKNSSDTRIDSISDAVEVITGVDSVTIQDNQDMSFLIYFDDPMSDLVRQLLVTFDLVPRPQGVKFSGFIEPPSGVRFGFSEPGLVTPPDIAGFSELGDASALWSIEAEDYYSVEADEYYLLGMYDPHDAIRSGGGSFVEFIKVG